MTEIETDHESRSAWRRKNDSRRIVQVMQQVGYEARDLGDLPGPGVGYREARVRVALHVAGEGLSDVRRSAVVTSRHVRVRRAVGELHAGSAVTVCAANGVYAEILLVRPVSRDRDERSRWRGTVLARRGVLRRGLGREEQREKERRHRRGLTSGVSGERSVAERVHCTPGLGSARVVGSGA